MFLFIKCHGDIRSIQSFPTRRSSDLAARVLSNCLPSRVIRPPPPPPSCSERDARSEEHTSELQSQSKLVCRLLLEKKKATPSIPQSIPPNTSPFTSWNVFQQINEL